jgi:CTP synthase (UTP-ammonia lyase)
MKTICILGDYDAKMPTHRALDNSREEALTGLTGEMLFEWVATDELSLADLGSRYQGLWVAPGSPYRDEARVGAALMYARRNQLPTFGNCGGFQFMVLEFARNVAGLDDAYHAESESGPGDEVIAPLACSLKGQTEPLIVAAGSRLAEVVGAGTMTGHFFCSYGIGPSYVPVLEKAGLVWTSRNTEGQPRSFELPGHRFYLGSLFQPALDSEAGRPNPLIRAFLEEVAR